jgi:hypothetical protein
MMKDYIYVFETDVAGHHSRGSALVAVREHGAIRGNGIGMQGTSYAIPTADDALRPLSVEKITRHVNVFLKFARLNPDMKFRVSQVGCGLGGRTDEQMAPLFKDAPDNCILPVGWRVLCNK